MRLAVLESHDEHDLTKDVDEVLHDWHLRCRALARPEITTYVRSNASFTNWDRRLCENSHSLGVEPQ